MPNVSMAGTGALILILESVLGFLGISIPEGSVSDAINGLTVFIGFVLLVWGQMRRKDLKWGLFRNPS